MATELSKKSSIDTIRDRFDSDVERFSDLETGQVATIDAPLAMELITEAAISVSPHIGRVLDIGCGAGNNTIKLLKSCGYGFDCHLNDLSAPMLKRAMARVSEVNDREVQIFEGDFREIEFEASSYDVVLAAAVFHHLRDDADWEFAFNKVYSLLRPGGSFWITDLVSHEIPKIQNLMWERYGKYLEGIGGEKYRDEVFSYIDLEDSPRPVTYQLELLHKVGFSSVEILHKNSCFAAFGAIK